LENICVGLDPPGADADHSVCGRGLWTRPDFPDSELCSGNCVLVGDLAPVRAGLLGGVLVECACHSPGSGHIVGKYRGSEQEFGTDDVRPERSTGHLGESQWSETGHQLDRGPGR
jgi:hypothetical protein